MREKRIRGIDGRREVLSSTVVERRSRGRGIDVFEAEPDEKYSMARRLVLLNKTSVRMVPSNLHFGGMFE